MKKQYLEPEMTAMAFDALDIIPTSYGVPHDDTADYKKIWDVQSVE